MLSSPRVILPVSKQQKMHVLFLCVSSSSNTMRNHGRKGDPKHAHDTLVYAAKVAHKGRAFSRFCHFGSKDGNRRAMLMMAWLLVVMVLVGIVMLCSSYRPHYVLNNSFPKTSCQCQAFPMSVYIVAENNACMDQPRSFLWNILLGTSRPTVAGNMKSTVSSCRKCFVHHRGGSRSGAEDIVVLVVYLLVGTHNVLHQHDNLTAVHLISDL
jgi:hypothetical protein